MSSTLEITRPVRQVRRATGSRVMPEHLERLSEFQHAAYHLALRVARNAADAEDIVQDAYLRSAKFKGALPPGEAAGPWFLKIVVNTARDRHAAEKSRHSRERKVAAVTAATAIDDATKLRDDPAFRAALTDAIDGLDEDLRVPLCLHYEQGRTHAETAEVLGMPAATVRSYASRAIQQLREKLSDRGYELTPALLLAYFAFGTHVEAPGGLSAKVARIVSGRHAPAGWKPWTGMAAAALLIGCAIWGLQPPRETAEEKGAAPVELPPPPVTAYVYVERDIEPGTETAVGTGAVRVIMPAGGGDTLSTETFYTGDGRLIRNTFKGKLIHVNYDDPLTSWAWSAANPDWKTEEQLITADPAKRKNDTWHTDGAKYIGNWKKNFEFEDAGEVMLDGHKCRLYKFLDYNAESRARSPQTTSLVQATHMWLDLKLGYIRRELMIFKNGRQLETLLLEKRDVPAAFFKPETYKTARTKIKTLDQVNAERVAEKVEALWKMDPHERAFELKILSRHDSEKEFLEKVQQGLLEKEEQLKSGKARKSEF